MIARVVILPSAGNLGLLDYAIDPSQEEQIRPGVRVLVPVGPRRAIAVVTALAETSDVPKLKTILAPLDTQPLLDASLLQLCHWMAHYYLGTIAEAISTAMPGSVQLEIERVVAVTSEPVAPEQETKLKPAEAELLAWLRERGSQTQRAIEKQFGASGRKSITALRRKEILQVREELHGGDGPTKYQRFFHARKDVGLEDIEALRRRRPAQHALFAYLQQHPLEQAQIHELAVTFANADSKLRELRRAGFVDVTTEEMYRTVFGSERPQDRIVPLTADQASASHAIEEALGTNAFQPMLLWGVTGSGKTEVYLQAIAACLKNQRTALVMVPEISLTHQVVDRIRARFGDRAAVLHSGLSDGERWDEWRKIARGEMPIVVGARSAVFAPLPRLGLVIVDEEHDPAFKQDDGVHYNGRDLAVVRAKLAGCPVVLGSATPAMETYYNATSGRYRLLTLPERVAARPLPNISIVDLRRASKSNKAILVSSQLIAALRANLIARGQSLVFLNRRGFANFLQCAQCGETLACPNCSVTLTLHQRWHALRCHHCDYTIPTPKGCPSCGGLTLGTWGAGTEQVESAMKQLVPGARVARMDRDSTSRKGSMRKLVDAWHKGEYDILVGTQMITKGHDVHDVTVVGVLLADQSLNFPDFRAAERTFQLITQVAGRAGRGERPGRVIVQTLQPEHFSLACAQHHDFRHFADVELAHRRELGYPPFTRLVKVRLEGEENETTERLAHQFAESIATTKGLEVLGPAPAPIERLRGRFRWQILLRSADSSVVRYAANRAREKIRPYARKAEVRVLVDVDPYNML